MKKLLIALALAVGFTASAAQFVAPSLINGNAVVCSNNFTINWYDTNVLYATEQSAAATTTTPFPSFNGTNGPATNWIILPIIPYNLAYTFESNQVIWAPTNYSGSLYSNIWRVDITNGFNFSGWTRDAQPYPDANQDGGLVTFTMGSVGSTLSSSNTMAVTLIKSTYDTNFSLLPADSFTFTVTNGVTGAANTIVPTTPMFTSTNLPAAFVQNARRIRIGKIVISSVGSSGYITIFDARLPQWAP